MSKDMRTAADNEMVQCSMRRVIEACPVEDCGFCAELRKVLEDTKDADDLHIESTG